MKAKKLMLAALTLGLGFTLGSCGESKVANYVVPEEFDTTQELTISFYTTMGDALQKVAQEAITKFQTDYPNVTVDLQAIGGYDDVKNQIVTEIPNDNQPNFAYCYPDHVALYNRAKAVVQLDSLIENEKFGFTKEELADFVPGYYEEGKQFGDDFMYTLPFSKSSEVLYYNKTAFDANGWTVPTTWEEMITVCRQIKEKYPQSTPLGIDSEANLFITICEQIGSGYTSATGEHYLFNNEENKAFVQQFKTWFDEGLFTTQTIIDAYTSTLFTQYVGATDTTYTGSFMSIGSTGGASHQYGKSFECGIAPVPTYGNVDLKCISQGPSLCVFQKENPQEVLATWIFIKDYFLDSTFQAMFSMASGYNPVLKSASQIPAYAEWLQAAKGTSKDGLVALSAKVCSELSNNFYTSPAFVGSSEARTQVGDLFVAVLKEAKTVDRAFQDAINNCEL